MNNKTTIREIRYHNTRLLQDSAGGQKAMVEITGKSQAQISSIAGANPSKNIGNNLAREIEQAFNKPTGWLDIWHDSLEDQESRVEEKQGKYLSAMHFNHEQITLLREIILIIERKKFVLTAEQKARLIAAVFASCTNNELAAEDLSDALIDAAHLGVM